MAEAAQKTPVPTPKKPRRAGRDDGPLADALNKTPTARSGPSILGIEVEVQFVLGHARVSVGTLMDMAQAHVLAMDRAPGDPVDVMVNGTRIAQGELVGEDDPDGGLGVRITRLCDGADDE